MGPIGNHLWQSTVFAGLVWTLTLALRKHRAQVRYALWLTASTKFLVPFSLLVSAGSLVQWGHSVPAELSIAPAIGQIVQPFVPLPEPVSMAAAAQASPAVPIAAAVWLAGFIVVLAMWSSGWRRIRRAVREARPLRMVGTVRVMSSPELLEPGVFGVFRSVLVLPDGIERRLTPEQLQAVVAHELCHVRRRDNLAGAIHMMAEAIFWFHPMVRWIGRRLVEERERACDEEVLRLGSQPEIYAEGILNVCKSYLESPLQCAAGISGGKLKRRIDAILANRNSRRVTTAGKILLACAGTVAVAFPLLVGMLDAQTLSFEVASVKPADPNARGIHMQFTPGGGIRIMNASLMQLLTMAYEVLPSQVSGGPAWIDSARFDIEGKAPAENVTPDEQRTRARLRMQTLLAERFKLASHRDKKDGAILALVPAKNGHKMKESDQGFEGLSGRPGQVAGERASMEMLARYLGGQLRRPVVDRTGLTKTYRFTLEWFPEMSGTFDPEKAAAAGVRPPDPSRPSLETAIQEQLGLKLEAQRGAVEMIVIERVEKPTAN
jgi:uncharacterized protein (TIGR03435 family)